MVKGLELKNGVITLRPYRKTDVYHAYEAVLESMDELSPWLYWCHPGYSIQETRAWVESRLIAWDKGTEYAFAITDPKKSVFLGGCSLTTIHPEHKLAELGYWVRTSRTGQGVATAAVNLLVQFGFTQLRLNRIEIVVMTGNKASQRVAEKVGAAQDGVLRNRCVVHGKVYDAVMFSVIPQDFSSND